MSEPMSVTPGYVMPLEDKLKSAQERADAYAEMFDIAQSKATDWRYKTEKLLAALDFYARHEHWMALTDRADCPLTNLIARKGDAGPDGWAVAEAAMKAVTEPSHVD